MLKESLVKLVLYQKSCKVFFSPLETSSTRFVQLGPYREVTVLVEAETDHLLTLHSLQKT